MLRVTFILHLMLSCTALSYSHKNRAAELKAFDCSPSAEGLHRRNFLAATAAAPLSFGVLASSPRVASAIEDLVDYKDEECKFSIKVPANWERSVQTLRPKEACFIH